MSTLFVRLAILLVMVVCIALTTQWRPLLGAQNPSLLVSAPIWGLRKSVVDTQGNLYVAGWLNQPGACVMKFTRTGALVYKTCLTATRFGGGDYDCGIWVDGLAVDRTGAAYVSGCSSAIDFPFVNQ